MNMPRSLGGGAFCEFCQLTWAIFIISGCSYVVFWLNHTGWWFALAAALLQTKCRASEPQPEAPK